MYSTIPQMLYEKAQAIPDTAIQLSKDKAGTFCPTSYGEFAGKMLDFSAGLASIGTVSGEHIGLISDNRKEWLVCSMGIMAGGCCDIPRGSEATVKDLSYILSFAECRTVVAESGYSFKKILECRAENSRLENIILIEHEGYDTGGAILEGLRVFSYGEILERGVRFRAENPGWAEEALFAGREEDTATIIFTSGTTGTPKGVELTHKNFICQLKDLSAFYPLKGGDRILCVLPVWHVYEREMENLFIYLGTTLCYSKPVVSLMMSDMKKVSPQFLACVPRIWDGLYKAIQKQVGADATANWLLFKTLVGATSTIRSLYDIIHGRNQQFKKTPFVMKILNKSLYIPILFLLPFRALGRVRFFARAQEVFGSGFKMGMSGGGGLPPKIDRFFNSIGVRLMEGYGLTETAPMCCMRNYKKPVLGTIGRILPFCEGRIVDRHGKECAPGQLGVLYIRGPNVMKGYYKQPELTAQAVSEGWFNTGDLVVRTYKSEIMVKGRQKDTIVLRSGENVEPFPLECKLAESPYIMQAVVVGQDKNCLGALIIPQKEYIKEYAASIGMNTDSMAYVLKSDEVRALIFKEMERLVSPKTGFKPFEKIGRFVFLEKPFEVGLELSAKQEVMRYKVSEIYKWQIMMMFNDSQVVQNLGTIIPQNLDSIIPANIISKLPGHSKNNQ